MSDQAQHTRGPWTINGNVVCFSSGFEYRPACKLLPCSGGEGTEHAYTHRESNEASAHLIKAAPDLLHAARLANDELCALGVGSSGSPALRALWWAIARAEGKEP